MRVVSKRTLVQSTLVSMNQPDLQAHSLAEFDRQPPVAYVEMDRYCDGCGYNLRTQPVRVDARTGLLLCRCPECGRFHPARDATTAGRVWLERLGRLLLFTWILTILGGTIGLGAAQIGATFITLEELTRYRQVDLNPPGAAPTPTTNPASTSSQMISVTPAGRIVVNTGNPTMTWRREVVDDLPYYALLITLTHGLSFGLGFLLALLAVVIFHHWRRWGYLVPVTLVPIIAGVIVWLVWREDVGHLLAWATPFIVRHAAAHLVGGLSGILLGRPLARLIVSLTLPPRIRQVLAFLWLADGKQPPATVAA